MIQDLDSTNGTFLDGRRVQDAVALPGSRISFGKVAFELWEEPALDSDGVAVAAEDPLDATILRQMPVQSHADIAAHLAAQPPSASVLRVGGTSAADRQAHRLALLLDIAKELTQQTELDRLLEKVVGLLYQVMSVERVALLTQEDGELVPRVWRSRVEGAMSGSWRVPRTVARKTVSERVALLLENFPASDARSEGATVAIPTIRSALCAPLLGQQGTVLGLLYLDNLAADHTFTEEDLDFLTAFAGMAAVAIENSQLLERVQREAVVLSNFQRYFAPDLARQIAAQTDEIRLGGSRRKVAVLFADIRGFTSLSEQMAPDEIAKLLTEYFTEMVDIVFEHGGILDKFMGDALMALWGAPVARDDDPDRAMRAAIAMQQGVQQLNADWMRQGRRTISVGIGLAMGEVFAGNIGSDRRLEYTVIGDAVNTAARLCAEAGPGDILVGETVYAALARPPRVQALEPLPLRGKAKAVTVYRVDW
jgi:adenylate cyclase